MKIYVAGRTKNIEEVNTIQAELTRRGHSITHDWTGPEGGISGDWSDSPELAKKVAIKDFLGVTNADGVIMCGYGCQEGGGGLGAFIEAGIALASNIPIVIVGPMRESVFWYAPIVARVAQDTDEDLSIADEAATASVMLESLHRRLQLGLKPDDATVGALGKLTQ